VAQVNISKVVGNFSVDILVVYSRCNWLSKLEVMVKTMGISELGRIVRCQVNGGSRVHFGFFF
jgi:hypothetical protein